MQPPPADSVTPSEIGSESDLATSDVRSAWLQVLVTSAFLVLAWAAYVEQTLHERRVAVEAASARTGNLALALELYLIRFVRNAEAVTQYVASEYVRGARGERLETIVRERAQNNDALLEVAILAADGKLLVADKPGSMLAGRTLRLPPVSGASMQLVEPIRPAPPRPERVVPFVRPVLIDGRAEVWVAVLVDGDRLTDLTAQADLAEDVLILVLGEDGQEYSRNWRAPDRMAAPGRGSTSEPPASNAGAALMQETGRIVRQRKVPGLPLQLAVGMSRDDALREAKVREPWYLAACAAITILGLLQCARVLSLARRRSVTARRLDRTRQRLSNLNAELEMIVLDRTRQLQQANQDLESFSYCVAHDLRAPLAAIDGFSAALEPAVNATGDERQQRHLQRVRAAATRMGQMIEALLMLARVGRQQLVRRPVDLSALAREVVDSLAERPSQGSIAVTIEDGLVAHGDPVLLRQVLDNLLGNAFKFLRDTPQPQVRFDAGPATDGQREFRVQDNGAGFDAEFSHKLFQPFSRLHGPEFPGTGVGLAIVARIVALHQGQLRTESAPGLGALFAFSLPIPPEAAPVQAAGDSTDTPPM